MLAENPRERPSANEILYLIMSKESFIIPGPLPSGDEDYSAEQPDPQYALYNATTRGVVSGVKEKLVKYFNQTGTK